MGRVRPRVSGLVSSRWKRPETEPSSLLSNRARPRQLETSDNLAVVENSCFDAAGFALGVGGCGVKPGFLILKERLKQLSAKGDELERLSQVVDFELFRADLEAAAPRADGSKGGRPAFDHVLMFKSLPRRRPECCAAGEPYCESSGGSP